MNQISPNAQSNRALVISPMLPPSSENDRGGMQRRVSLFLRAIARRFKRIDLVHIVPSAMLEGAPPDGSLDRAQSNFWGVPVHAYRVPRRIRAETLWNHYGAGILDASEQPALRGYGGAALADAIDRHLSQAPGIVYVDRLEAMLPVLQARSRISNLLLDLNDVEHKLRIGAIRPILSSAPNAAALLQLPALIWAEFQAVRRSTIATVCSEVDRVHLRRLGFGPRITVVPNAVTVPSNPPGLVPAPTVLFLGACNYGPNFDAAERLARRIWPLVRAQVPHARLVLAGKETDRLPSRAEGFAGVTYRGFVDNLACLYAETRLVCCPLIAGSGTRLKLVEAAGFARPMISTRIGAEGLDFTDGVDILLRESDQAIADACIHLLRDDAACGRLGANARATMTRLYDSDLIEAQIENLVAAITREEASPQPISVR